MGFSGVSVTRIRNQKQDRFIAEFNVRSHWALGEAAIFTHPLKDSACVKIAASLRFNPGVHSKSELLVRFAIHVLRPKNRQASSAI